MSALQALVEHFDRDAAGNRNLLRELLESNPDGFYADAIEALKRLDDSRGLQYVIALLVAYDLLLKALCDPALTRAQSVELARAAARVDPMVDVALAKRLADSATSPESNMRPDDAGRIMEILSGISQGTRILPSLMRMMRHSNPHVRSKAVKLVGRGNGSVKWVRGRLAESDPRIRANAIEALWGADSEEIRELLQSASLDGNNRVAGNALLALYRLGDCAAIPQLVTMSEHGSALFRGSAAWVMGETGDPRFSEALARMLREPSSGVRTRAMSALRKIKTAVSQARLGPQWVASSLLLESEPQKSSRRLQLALACGTAGKHEKILPTQFLLTEDGKHILNYKVLERPAPEAISAIFLFPRSATFATSAWARGAYQCLAWKRPSDLWAVQWYLTESGEAESDVGLRYSANPETIERMLHSSTNRSDCAELWQSVWQATRADQAPARGRRHLILFANSERRSAAGDGLVSAVRASQSTVQAIASGPNPELQDFCAKVRGTFRVAETHSEIAEAISLAYLNRLARHEITYHPISPEARNLRIRINTPSGWAETSLSLTPPISKRPATS